MNTKQLRVIEQSVTDLRNEVAFGIISSCTCVTKTNDTYYHEDSCTFKKMWTALTLLEQVREIILTIEE